VAAFRSFRSTKRMDIWSFRRIEFSQKSSKNEQYDDGVGVMS
jgi:hypothetical protein